MKIFLIRHGHALKRSEWTESDELRPLSTRGERQASGIQSMLKQVPLRRICSSPAIRCRHTVERLATDHLLPIEEDPRLAADSDDALDLAGALELLEDKGGEPIVICTSGKLIRAILEAVGVAEDAERSLRCQKGSIWVLERRAGTIARAEYVPPREASRGERRAVIEISSTTISLLVADVGPEKGRIQPIRRSQIPIESDASSGGLGSSDIDRIATLAASMHSEAEAAGSGGPIAVATTSLCDAADEREVARSLDGVLESPLRILSGPEQAEIVYHAVRRRLGLEGLAHLVVDLGDGSLELALGRGSKILHAASVPLGVSRVHAKLVRSDPMKKAEAEAIRERVRERIKRHRKKLVGRRALRCTAAGGTVRALATLAQAARGGDRRQSVRGVTLLRTELESLAARLRRASRVERFSLPGMTARNVDLLPTGAIILAELLAQLDLAELRVCDWGLREGLLLEKPDVSAAI